MAVTGGTGLASSASTMHLKCLLEKRRGLCDKKCRVASRVACGANPIQLLVQGSAWGATEPPSVLHYTRLGVDGPNDEVRLAPHTAPVMIGLRMSLFRSGRLAQSTSVRQQQRSS